MAFILDAQGDAVAQENIFEGIVWLEADGVPIVLIVKIDEWEDEIRHEDRHFDSSFLEYVLIIQCMRSTIETKILMWFGRCQNNYFFFFSIVIKQL